MEHHPEVRVNHQVPVSTPVVPHLTVPQKVLLQVPAHRDHLVLHLLVPRLETRVNHLQIVRVLVQVEALVVLQVHLPLEDLLAVPAGHLLETPVLCQV